MGASTSWAGGNQGFPFPRPEFAAILAADDGRQGHEKSPGHARLHDGAAFAVPLAHHERDVWNLAYRGRVRSVKDEEQDGSGHRIGRKAGCDRSVGITLFFGDDPLGPHLKLNQEIK